MKFQDISREQWDELGPFFDTCLLPVTALSGDEPPWKAAEALEMLRDLLAWIEVPFKGRVVTVPALQYRLSQDTYAAELDKLCGSLKSIYRFVVVATLDEFLAGRHIAGADLVVGPSVVTRIGETPSGAVRAAVERMWASGGSSEKADAND